MKIERINESQIRCTLDSFDLNVRNLNISELAYGSEKAKNLFTEMLQKAKSEVGFEAEDTALMIEAVPTSPESITLVITKVDEPEEVDTRFARFSPSPEDEAKADFLSMLAQVPTLEGADVLGKNELPIPDGPVFRVFVFNDLDSAVDACHAVSSMNVTDSSLYKNVAEKKYYLLLDGEKTDPITFASTCNTLNEYAKVAPHNYSSKAYFKEHYDVLIEHNAIDALSKM